MEFGNYQQRKARREYCMQELNSWEPIEELVSFLFNDEGFIQNEVKRMSEVSIQPDIRDSAEIFFSELGQSDVSI
ncbi:hypothetical protein MA16_Dca002153 [Dendrobium catenatum]|uniref:Uncharacterized protein n=1 Tax=Dendrobium catenatum TaxID=906689 RepID=A0A2I0XEI7_9ASPA|nr:hypothetical protein MA16_Dca002153 [Dendrobium catenatum]